MLLQLLLWQNNKAHDAMQVGISGRGRGGDRLINHGFNDVKQQGGRQATQKHIRLVKPKRYHIIN